MKLWLKITVLSAIFVATAFLLWVNNTEREQRQPWRDTTYVGDNRLYTTEEVSAMNATTEPSSDLPRAEPDDVLPIPLRKSSTQPAR
jgi:hypothetical protein